MDSTVQVSGTKAVAFISYAREDKELVSALIAALARRGIETTGDWLLTPGENYESKLRELSMTSHALIFVITPDSIRSEACRNELAFAVECKKQILPVSRRDHGDDTALDSALRAPQWIFLRDGDDFDRGVGELVTGINTDFALMETHGRLLLAAESWKNNGRNRSYLLRKDGLKEAESWLVKTSVQPEKLPQPTPLEVEFILAGQRARGRGTRIAVGVVAVIALALSALSVVALIQRSRALQEKAIADDRFIRLSVASGVRLLDQADVPAALLWFANPLSIHPRDEAVHRQRVAATEAAYPRLMQLLPHDANIVTAQLNAAGDRLLTLSGDSSIRVWNPRTGALLWSEGGGKRKITAAALSPDGATCAVVSEKPLDQKVVDQFLKDGEKESGQPAEKIDPAEARQVVELLVGPTSEVRLLDGASGALRATAEMQIGSGSGLWALPGNAYVLAGSAGMGGSFSTTVLWRPGRSADVQKLSENELSRVSVSPDGKTFLGGEYGGRWQLLGSDGKVMASGWHDAASSSGGLSCLALSPTGTRLATADSGGKIIIWDAAAGKPVGKPIQHGSEDVNAVAFSPDGRWLAATGGFLHAKTVTVYDVVTEGKVFSGELNEPGHGVTFSPSGRYLISLSRQWNTLEGAAQVWDVGTGLAVSPPVASVFEAAWGGDDRTMVTTGSDHTVKVWDLFPTGTMLSLDQQELLRNGHFTPDGQVVVVEAGQKLRRLPIDRFDGARFAAEADRPSQWDRASVGLDRTGTLSVRVGDNRSQAFQREQEVSSFEHKYGEKWVDMAHVSAVDISSDGRTVLIAGGNGSDNVDTGRILVWDANTGQARMPPLEHRAFIDAASFSPDGRLILSASRDGTAQIWSAANGAPLHRLAHGSAVQDAVFDGSGGRVATAALDSGVRIWNAATGALIGPVMHLDGAAVVVRFSPDEKSLLTVAIGPDNKTGVMRLWDVATHQAKAAPVPLGQMPYRRPDAAFSPDGRLIIASEGQNGYRVWDSSTMEPVTPHIDSGSESSRYEAADKFLARQRPLLAARDRAGAPLLVGVGTQPASAHRVIPWALPSDARPAEAMLPELELMASRRIDVTGALVRLTPEEIKGRWEQRKRQRQERSEDLAAWHRREVEECDALREWSCVVWHIERLPAVDASLLIKKGHALAEMERWADAAAAYARARALGAGAADTVPSIARLRVAGGDPRERGELVAALIELAKASPLRDQREDFLRAALLAPSPLADRDRATLRQLAEADYAGAKDGSQRYDAQGILALLDYRSGRAAEALAHLDAMQRDNDAQRGDFLPALVTWRAGDHNAAARYYDKAKQAMQLLSGERRYHDGHHASSLYWYQWLERVVMQAEAADLIEKETRRR